jgi:hypothetical protein
VTVSINETQLDIRQHMHKELNVIVHNMTALSIRMEFHCTVFMPNVALFDYANVSTTNVVVLSVDMLNVVVQNAVVPTVAAPSQLFGEMGISVVAVIKLFFLRH